MEREEWQELRAAMMAVADIASRYVRGEYLSCEQLRLLSEGAERIADWAEVEACERQR